METSKFGYKVEISGQDWDELLFSTRLSVCNEVELMCWLWRGVLMVILTQLSPSPHKGSSIYNSRNYTPTSAFLMSGPALIFLPLLSLHRLYNVSLRLRPAKHGFNNQHIKILPLTRKEQSILRASNKNMWLSCAASPRTESSVCNLLESPGLGSWKGTNESCSTDGSALRVCEGVFLNEDRRMEEEEGGWVEI